MLRREDEVGIVWMSPSRRLIKEALSFVEDGWGMFEIKIKLFDGKEFDEEIKYVRRPLDRVRHRWKEPDPHELMHVEGLPSKSFFCFNGH